MNCQCGGEQAERFVSVTSRRIPCLYGFGLALDQGGVASRGRASERTFRPEQKNIGDRVVQQLAPDLLR